MPFPHPIAMYGSKKRLVIISWSEDYDEYVCKIYHKFDDGTLQHVTQYDYYTSDEDDARETARQMAKEDEE